LHVFVVRLRAVDRLERRLDTPFFVLYCQVILRVETPLVDLEVQLQVIEADVKLRPLEAS